jgi:DNA-binding CsgD family transcriptional regulator
MGITGKPGKGKTTALMYYVTILLQAGAEVFVWDPHGAMADMAVLNGCVLQGMPATAKMTYLDRKEDIMRSVPMLLAELAARDELYRIGQQTKHPLLLLADELPVLADFDEEIVSEYKAMNKRLVKEGDEEVDVPSLLKIIRKMVLEARKWRCFFIGSGQSFDAQILPTRVTENFNSRIVFFSSDRRARMSGLENDAIKNLLPTIRRAGSGVMIFDCARWDEPVIGALPYITVADMLQFLGVSTSSATSPRPVLHLVEAGLQSRFEVATEPIEAVTPSTALSEREAYVLQLLAQGFSQKQIIQDIWHTSGGDKYVKASAELQQIIKKLVTRERA